MRSEPPSGSEGGSARLFRASNLSFVVPSTESKTHPLPRGGTNFLTQRPRHCQSLSGALIESSINCLSRSAAEFGNIMKSGCTSREVKKQRSIRLPVLQNPSIEE